ncbi:MAG: alkaline shock response membrane anchor protein AmaP [Enterococcus sp.]
MQRILKWLCALCLFLGLVGTGALFFQIYWLKGFTPLFRILLQRIPFVHNIFLNQFIILTILLAALFIFLLFVPSERQNLVHKTKKGTVKTSKETLDVLVKNACWKVMDANKLKIRVKIKRKNNFSVKIRFYVQNVRRFESVANDLEAAVNDALGKCVPAETFLVTVELKEVKRRNGTLQKKRRVL